MQLRLTEHSTEIVLFEVVFCHFNQFFSALTAEERKWVMVFPFGLLIPRDSLIVARV